MSQTPKVQLKTFGCRLNQAEIDQMARDFAARGYALTETSTDADLLIVNTCAVTQEATRSSRQAIHQFHRANPDAQIAVTGCYAHISGREIAAIPGVTHVIDNHDKAHLVDLVSIIDGSMVAPRETFDDDPLIRAPIHGITNQTRAFIKVQDGCDRLCSFCVTRIARGKGVSRDFAAIVDEVRTLVQAGVQEAVLTGVHLGSYGDDLHMPDGLATLIRTLLTDTDIPRLRLSSLEPWGITDSFYDLLTHPRFGKHLHLPLQSGCDATLRRMIRRVTGAEFRSVVDQARAAAPDVSITTDIIVGFPGETDDEFTQSRDFIESMHFSGAHIFRYSKRPGTAAVKLPNQVDEDVKKDRSAQLHTIAARDESAFAARFTGTIRPVLWEAVSGATEHGYLNNGYTDNFLRVVMADPAVLTNQTTAVKLGDFDPHTHTLHAKPQHFTSLTAP